MLSFKIVNWYKMYYEDDFLDEYDFGFYENVTFTLYSIIMPTYDDLDYKNKLIRYIDFF